MSPRTMPSFTAIPPPPPPAAVELYAQPSDVTLVNEILRPWITSGVVTSSGAAGVGYVHAADLYAADPERLAWRFSPAVSTVDGERAWYFLSPLRCRSPRDRRKVRATADGAGCWHSEAAPKHVFDVDVGGGGGGGEGRRRRRRVVGYRQSFSFMRRGAATGAEGRTGWIMAEFHLHHQHDGGGFGFGDEDDDGEGGGGRGRKVEGLVLCKMYRSPRNRGCPVVVIDKDDNGVRSGGVALVAAEEKKRFFSGKRRRRRSVVDDDEDSDALTAAARLQRDGNGNNSDCTGGAVTTPTSMTTAPPPLLVSKKAADDEVSGATTTTAAAVGHKGREEEEDDMPARKKMRPADGESYGAAESVLRKAMAAGDGGGAEQLMQYCPQCGFHLAALQAIVTLAKSGLDLAVARGDVLGDCSETVGSRFRRELLNAES